MSTKFPCYLKTYRRRAGMTQKELALLLGLNHDTTISKFERRRREPSLHIAIGCEVIFGEPASALFPGIYACVAERVSARADQLDLPVPVLGGADKQPELPLSNRCRCSISHPQTYENYAQDNNSRE